MSNNNPNDNDTTEVITVQVALRIRPLSAEELVNIPSRLQKNVISTSPFTPNQVVVQGEKKRSFTFDHVFRPDTTQKEIYDKTVMNLVDQFLEGNNVTLLAFGHKSSGKTYTIGTDNSSLTQESKGIIPRSMVTLLSRVNSAQYKTRKFSMKISFVEIYNDELIDLLCEGDGDDKKANVALNALQEIKVNNTEEVMGLLSLGQLNRRANAQEVNQNGSHVIVTVILTQQKFVPPSTNHSLNTPPATPNKLFSPRFGRGKSRDDYKQFEGDCVTVTSKFHFVDLAGNEMEKGNFGLEDRLKEHFSSTNETTTKVAIGNVICAFADPSQTATLLSYKDNQLTKILQNYLGNNTQALIIACVSPAEYNIKETINTLEYAKYARNIKYTSLKPININQEEEGWNDLEHLQSLILKLRSEIKDLKNDSDTGSISSLSSSVHNGQPNLSGEKEINLLEDKFVILKRSFKDLSKEFVKSKVLKSTTMIPEEENPEKSIFDHDTSCSEEDTADDDTLVQDDSSTSSSNNESGLNDIQNVWPCFQKAVGPVIQEYEKSISSLENQLSLVRAALSHSESKMYSQERKLNEAEEINEKNMNIINDLKHNISKLNERGETTENYIKDLEEKLNSDIFEREKDQIIINDLKNRVEELLKDEESNENDIRKLESNLEEIEIKSGIDLQLEKDLSKEEDKFQALTQQYEKQKDIDKEEMKWLLGEIKTRDDRILKLEKNVENLVEEIERTRQLKVEKITSSHTKNNHSKSSSISSILNTDTQFFAPSPSTQIGEFSSVSTLEYQINDLQITHEKALAELNYTQTKYQTSLAELKELRSQITDAQLEKFVKAMANSKNEARSSSADISGEKDEITTDNGDTAKQEFARLQLNYRETLELVEELCEEIKRRDDLAQLEVVSGKDSCGDHSAATNDELVQKLKGEVEQLKNKQRETLEILAEQEKISTNQLVMMIEKNIAELKAEMNRLNQEQNENVSKRSSEVIEKDNEIIQNLQVRIITLEEQLVKAQEIQKNSPMIIESSNDNFIEFKKLLQMELQNQVGQLQKEIVAKSHVITSLLYPSFKYQLEGKIEETRQGLRDINNTATRSQKSTSIYFDSIEESASDCLEQNSNEYLKELEENVKNLEDQLTKTKVIQHDTIIQIPLLNISQKFIKEFQEKFDFLHFLQRELVNKSETSESSQIERDTVIGLQEQFENLKAEIKAKHELIESIKKDLTNNVMLEKRLRQNEEQILSLKINLLQVQQQEETLQKEIIERKKCLENDDVNKVLQSELDRLRKELKDAHERETVSLEKLQVLKERLENDSEESQLQEQIVFLQNVEIMQKNRIIDLENRIFEKGAQVDEYLVQLKTDLVMAKESKTSHIKAIEALETKLKNVEQGSLLCQQIHDLKLKESEQLQKIDSLQVILNDQTASDFNQKNRLLEEVGKTFEQQECEFAAITNSLEEFKQDSGINSMRNEINELKYSKSDLLKKVQEMQTKLAVSEEQLLVFESLQEEVSYLKSLSNEQKIAIQQFHLQLNQMRDSKKSTVTELITLKDNFNLQKEVVNLLETEMKNLKEELVITQENHVSLTQEFGKVSSSLDATQEQYANEKKQVKALEIEVETLKLAVNSGDTNVDSLREALTNTKLEMFTQNEMLTELEAEMMTIEKERDHHIKLSEKLTVALEKCESQHQESIKELKSQMSILEGELALAQESSKISSEVIESLQDKLFDIQSQFEDTKNSDKEHFEIIKEMETKLNDANEALKRSEDKLVKQDSQISDLEDFVQKSNFELQNAQTSKMETERRIEELESKIAEAEMEVVKETTEKQMTRIKELEELLLKAQQEQSMIKTNNIIELEKTKAAESARIKELEDKLEEKDINEDELQQFIEFSNVELMKLQKSEIKYIEHINELEGKLQDIENQRVKEISKLDEANKEIESLKCNCVQLQQKIEKSKKFANIVYETQDSRIKKAVINEFTNSNELLWNNNNNLIAKIIELEARATTLINHNENLQDELTNCDSCDVNSLMEMKVKIKELQDIKEELEDINVNFFEKCGNLEEKVQSLMKQLWTLGNDGNEMALQVANLNDQIVNREKEINTLRQKSTAGHKASESEISRLLSENESLKEKIKDLSTQAAKGINAALVHNLSEESNSLNKDEIIIPKLLQHENKIAQQNDLIEKLQKHILELEQLLDEFCNDANNDNANKSRNTRENVVELLAEIQKLDEKLLKTESENVKNQQLVKTLEITVNENEARLQRTKEQLNSVLSEKQDLLKHVNGLKSVLEGARSEIESTKTVVETQKIHMEKALDEERKAKERSEKARIALENRVEKLMAKKNKFMCF